MYKISQDICNATKNKVAIKELSNAERLEILRLVEEKYIDLQKKEAWLWERFHDYEFLQINNGWHRIKEFVLCRECVLFFNQNEEKTMFFVSSGDDLDYILSETSGYEFYVTDSECTYLICFNHHDILYGCGTAYSWIKSIKINRGIE